VDTVIVGTGPLSFADVVAVARGYAAVELSAEAEYEITASRKVIEALAGDDQPHYGVSTGFGALATRHIPVELRAQLQRSLIRSHAAGSGAEVETEVVRAMLLLRLSTLATGRTGVRLQVARTYAAMLNARITPVVHEYGSLGCSGDLAPLAHCALAAMGEGTVRVGPAGNEVPAREALDNAGIEPLILAEKEGLALINGTDGMLGMLVLAGTDLCGHAQRADHPGGPRIRVARLLGRPRTAGALRARRDRRGHGARRSRRQRGPSARGAGQCRHRAPGPGREGGARAH